MKKEILEFSFKNNLAHIPSALSMCDYLQVVFNYVKKEDNIIIGKPFGAQAYYIIWKKLGWINDIVSLHMGVKHDEIEFVDYSEETIGNALGVASGIQLANKKKTYVNLSDAALQMGNTLEAIQFIGKHRQNIFVTIDYNNSQVIGRCSEIIPIEPVFDFFEKNGWKLFFVHGNNVAQLNSILQQNYNLSIPVVVVCYTTKGNGIPEMENDIKKWHYRKLNEKDLESFLKQVQK